MYEPKYRAERPWNSGLMLDPVARALKYAEIQGQKKVRPKCMGVTAVNLWYVVF